MRKLCKLFLVMVMALSVFVMSTTAQGNLDKSNTKGSETRSNTSATLDSTNTKETAEDTSATDEATNDSPAALNDQAKKQENMQKQFKTELNEKKKELQQQKCSFNQQAEDLKVQYDALIASGDTVGAEAVLASINALNEQMKTLQEEIKIAINERFMVVKTMYSDAELEKFNNASDLIAQMYKDATVLDAGCVTANNNLIKFDAPAYIKGGVTLVPLRAISEKLGGQVAWNEESYSVTITKGDTVIEITANSTTVLVNGAPVEMSTPAEVTCGRTYLPLRFLAEALGCNVAWDGENEIIDIDDGNATDTTDTAGDTTSTENTSTTTPAA